MTQKSIFFESLDDMVDANDPCRLVSALVDLLDVSCLTKRLSLQGGASYHPSLMLKLWMFSLWDGERSSRKIEKRCSVDLRYKWLAEGLVPDHTTLHRFRRFLGPSLDEMLAESVALGRKIGMEGLGRASIDGTKLPGAASQWRVFREESELADEDLEAEVEDDDQNPGTKSGRRRVALPSKDADARTMRSRSGQFIVGYNAQFLHDCDTDLVLATSVSSEASDAAQLAPTLDKCLDLHEELPGELLADAGYDTPANAQVLAELGIDATVAASDRSMKWSVDERGLAICPAGHLADRRSSFKKNGVPVVRFHVDECPNCSLRSGCLKNERAKSKTISLQADASLVHWIRQREKACSEAGKEGLKERAETVEFAFARVKERFGLRRLLLWGLEGARIETTFAALTLNLAVLGAKLGLEGVRELLSRIFRFLSRLQDLLERLSWPTHASHRTSIKLSANH